MNVSRGVYLVLLLITLFCYLGSSGGKKFYTKMVVALMILWLFTAVSAIILVRIFKVQNNLILFHISTPIEYVIIASMYHSLISNKLLKKIISLSLPGFILVSIFLSTFIQGVKENNSYAIILESIILIFLSLFFLREILVLQPVVKIYKYPAFWITVGILAYFTGNFLIEGMLNFMVSQSLELARRTYLVGYIFKYILFIVFIIGKILSVDFKKRIN